MDDVTAPVDILDEWAAVGLEPHTLPSGYQVRLRIPKPRDLVVSGLLPLQLIQDTMDHAGKHGGLDNVVTEDPDLGERLVRAIRTLAADSIRQVRMNADEPWRPKVVPVDRYVLLPEDDREYIEALVEARLADLDEPEDAEGQRRSREEAAGTIDAYRPFPRDGRRDARRPGRTDVRPAPVNDDRAARPAGRAGARPGARRAPREG